MDEKIEPRRFEVRSAFSLGQFKLQNMSRKFMNSFAEDILRSEKKKEAVPRMRYYGETSPKDEKIRIDERPLVPFQFAVAHNRVGFLTGYDICDYCDKVMELIATPTGVLVKKTTLPEFFSHEYDPEIKLWGKHFTVGYVDETLAVMGASTEDDVLPFVYEMEYDKSPLSLCRLPIKIRKRGRKVEVGCRPRDFVSVKGSTDGLVVSSGELHSNEPLYESQPIIQHVHYLTAEFVHGHQVIIASTSDAYYVWLQGATACAVIEKTARECHMAVCDYLGLAISDTDTAVIDISRWIEDRTCSDPLKFYFQIPFSLPAEYNRPDKLGFVRTPGETQRVSLGPFLIDAVYSDRAWRFASITVPVYTSVLSATALDVDYLKKHPLETWAVMRSKDTYLTQFKAALRAPLAHVLPHPEIDTIVIGYL